MMAVMRPDLECKLLCGDDEYHHLKCPVARALRQEWCTPKWLAELIGPVDMDPCSNGRSHIQARWKFDLAKAEDGLAVAATHRQVVFINPPYGGGQVVRWVDAYCHTRFIFLLRWDPSTEWFAELLPKCDYVWFPPDRIGFEPPPRIRESSNPYPHALYLRDPSPELLDRLRGAGYLLDVRSVRGQTGDHARHRLGTEPGGEGEAATDGASGGGGAAGESGAGEGFISRGIAAWIPASCPSCDWPVAGHCSCNAAGGEVPGPARSQRVRRNPRRGATSG